MATVHRTGDNLRYLFGNGHTQGGVTGGVLVQPSAIKVDLFGHRGDVTVLSRRDLVCSSGHRNRGLGLLALS